MLTWLQSSRKCLIIERQSLGLYSSFLFLFLILTAASAYPSPTPTEALLIEALLKKEIWSRESSSFELLMQKFETRYGNKAMVPLLRIASDVRNEDSDRYVALMSAAKLGGAHCAPMFVRFLKDKSWMIRSGALRTLKAFKNPKTAYAVLPLLKDPALVVRTEAIEAIEALHPPNAIKELVSALHESSNYHAGKAQWVPQKALAALLKLNADSKIAIQLQPLLHHEKDPELQRQTIQTLEALTGKKIKFGAKLAEQIRAWDQALRATN
jgi:hypothetical protein